MNEPPPILLVRALRGTVGETRRTVHVVPLTDSTLAPEMLTAYCGERFMPGMAERLDQPSGTPCVWCLAIAPAAPGAIGTGR